MKQSVGFSRIFFVKKAGKFKLFRDVGNHIAKCTLYICMKKIMCASRKSTLYLLFRGKNKNTMY